MTPQRPIPVLLTRPSEQGARFAMALTDRFGPRITLTASPLIAPHFLTPDLPKGRFSALILTSETGAEGARRLLRTGRSLPARAFCVGDRTAEAALQAGFRALSAKGDARALVGLILASGDPGPFLHLRGQDSRGDILPQLAAAGLTAAEAVAYDQRPVPLTDAARGLLAGPDTVIVPIFSPRTAQLLAAEGPFAAPLWLAALSPAVAQAAAALAPARQSLADAPNADALLSAVAALLPPGPA